MKTFELPSHSPSAGGAPRFLPCAADFGVLVNELPLRVVDEQHGEVRVQDLPDREEFRGIATEFHWNGLHRAITPAAGRLQPSDFIPGHVHDPMTMVLRQRAIQDDLMRWDDSRGRYVLTGAGRSRIVGRPRAQGKVVRFQARADRNQSANRKA